MLLRAADGVVKTDSSAITIDTMEVGNNVRGTDFTSPASGGILINEFARDLDLVGDEITPTGSHVAKLLVGGTTANTTKSLSHFLVVTRR